MEARRAKWSREKKWYYARMVLFCLACLAINLLFAQIPVWLNLPLYLDCIGVVLAAAIGGYIPGIIVGYLSNIINSVTDPTIAFYGTLAVFIAVLAGYFAGRGWLKKFRMLPLTIFSFAFVGGFLGSILTWFLSGFDFGNGISAPVAQYLYEHAIHNKFFAQVVGEFLVDIPDKIITMIPVLILLYALPQKFQDRFHSHAWKQKPLTDEELKIVKGQRRENRRHSLRAKILLLLSAAMVIIAIVTTGISFRLFHVKTIDDTTLQAEGILGVAKDYIDADRVNEFIGNGSAAEGYDETKALLSSLQKSNANVEYVYTYQIRPDGCYVVFDPDTEDLLGEEPGTRIDFDQAFAPYMDDLLAGRKIEPVISNETYGWLLTLYEPVIDSSGTCVCYVAVDISMNDLVISEYSFLARVISLFLGFFVLIVAIVLNRVDYNMVIPINAMTLAAKNFAFNSEDVRMDSVEKIREMNIHTGDEVEELYQAFCKTTEDMVQYVADVQEKNETISRMQERLIEVMADMVESRDQFTGDHVRKTAAYARIILEEMRREGLHKEELTDAFIEDVVHSAPLHDVGKIQVSDVLLNKPGKLTDEEFAKMQYHTVAGKEIILRATDAVSDAGYLSEAVNLAAYHHEKWNGKGYPYGISGEDIPLSARVMAVADVFDALVSKRSYKEGFPIEKALDIIREGIGSHFDPDVANAFLNAEEEVRKVAAQHMEGVIPRRNPAKEGTESLKDGLKEQDDAKDSEEMKEETANTQEKKGRRNTL